MFVRPPVLPTTHSRFEELGQNMSDRRVCPAKLPTRDSGLVVVWPGLEARHVQDFPLSIQMIQMRNHALDRVSLMMFHVDAFL